MLGRPDFRQLPRGEEGLVHEQADVWVEGSASPVTRHALYILEGVLHVSQSAKAGKH